MKIMREPDELQIGYIRLYNNTNISDLIRVTTQNKHLKGLPDLTCNFIFFPLQTLFRRNPPTLPTAAQYV